VVTLSLLTVSVFAIFALRQSSLPNVISAVVAIFVVAGHVLSTLKWARRESSGEPVASRGQLANAADALAHLVKTKLDKDPLARHLMTYEPMKVLWVQVHDGPPIAWAERSATTLAGDINQLASEFPDLPTKRLAILGPAGSGKTALAILLTIGLLKKDRGSTDVVPVLLSLTEWDVEHESCADWVARRLADMYPALCDGTSYGNDAPKRLVHDRMILPVLDGLDEVPPTRRSAALKELNELMGHTNSLVLTARTSEYCEAVAEAGETLVQTLVIELSPVAVQDAVSYIQQRTARGRRLDSWQYVFDQLQEVDHQEHPHPLTEVLSTPLMISLARRVFNSGSADPEDLIDAARFPDSVSIKRHLLSVLVPTVFDEESRRGHRPWTGQQARRWLTTVAAELNRTNTHEFRWWQLYRNSTSLSGPYMRAIVLGVLVWAIGGVAYGLSTGLRHGLAYGAVHGPVHGLAFGLATVVTGLLIPRVVTAREADSPLKTVEAILLIGLLAGSAYGLVHGSLAATTYGLTDGIVTGLGFAPIVGAGFGFGVWFAGLLAPPGEPTRADLHMSGRGRRFFHSVSVPLLNSTLVGVLVGVPSELLRRIDTSKLDRPAIGFWTCVSFGLCFGVVIGFVKWVSEPLASDNALTPRSSLTGDRALVLLRSILLGMSVVTVFAMMAVIRPGQGTLSTFVSQGGIEGGAMAAVVCFLSGAWSLYRLAHVRLVLRGDLPLRLMAFLEAARQLGILRQAGDVYQFRHSMLRDHLAATKGQPSGG
jgi:hypothetical protein